MRPIRPCGSEVRETERHVTSNGHVLLLDPHNLRAYTREDWSQSVCPILVGWKCESARICRPGWEEALDEGAGKSPGLKGLCKRIGVKLGQAERKLEREGRKWASSKNPGSDERQRRMARSEGPESSERAMLELNRQGRCARCGQLGKKESKHFSALPARTRLPSGREVSICRACSALQELEGMERGGHKYGGYLGRSGLYGGRGEITTFVGFPIVVLTELYQGSAGFGGDSWHWRGWDRWNREWWGWNGGGPHYHTNMNLITEDRHPGRSIYDLSGVTFSHGVVSRLRRAQDEWLEEHGGQALPFRFNPEERRRRRGRTEGPEALLAQVRAKKQQGQELTPLEWLVDEYGKIDLGIDRKAVSAGGEVWGYTPAPGVLISRARSRFERERAAALPIMSYRTQFGDQQGVHFSLSGMDPAGSFRRVGVRQSMSAFMTREEARALVEAEFGDLVLGQGGDWIVVGYPDSTPYREAWGPYVLWLRQMGGARERLPSEFV